MKQSYLHAESDNTRRGWIIPYQRLDRHGLHVYFLIQSAQYGGLAYHSGKTAASTKIHPTHSKALPKAHAHAWNAVLETRRSNAVAASEEHDLAAAEFARAAEKTADAEVRSSERFSVLSSADLPSTRLFEPSTCWSNTTDS